MAERSKCRRTKERRIGHIIDKVLEWRKYYSGLSEKTNNKQERLSLEEAAKNPAIAGGVRGVVFRGNRYDTGDKLNFIKATIKLGVDRDDIGQDLREFLRNFAKTL